ncbi:hypothetical protein A2U01_0049767, partial [Trifolium medium]|nr:hypothetical protein [Trifolium medium]
FLSTARRAGIAGVLRALAEDKVEMLCQLHVAQERMARHASQREGCIRSLCQLLVAHLHMARRAPSKFITRVAHIRWRGAQIRNLYKESSFSDLKRFFWLELEKEVNSKACNCEFSLKNQDSHCN